MAGSGHFRRLREIFDSFSSRLLLDPEGFAVICVEDSELVTVEVNSAGNGKVYDSHRLKRGGGLVPVPSAPDPGAWAESPVGFLRPVIRAIA